MPGSGVIICTRGRRSRLCGVCRKNPSTRLCDGDSMANVVSGTCDLPLCVGCSVTEPDPNNRGKRLDFCPSCVETRKATNG